MTTKERVKQLISDPAFYKPISDLNKDYSKQGVRILVTRIKPQSHNGSKEKRGV